VQNDRADEFVWRCSNCAKEHKGLPLDFVYAEPASYHGLGPEEKASAFLNADFCSIEAHGWYFVRGLIELPIIGMRERFRWGVWSSLSKNNFDYTVAHWDDPNVESSPPMFGWLNSSIEHYPDTLNLKLSVHLKRDTRPFFEVEPTDHPLALEQQQGISLERIQAIAARVLH